MQRFFFHVRAPGRLVEDVEGSEFDGVEEARTEAVACARELAAECVRSGGSLFGRAVEISDERGETMGKVAFSAVTKPTYNSGVLGFCLPANPSRDGLKPGLCTRPGSRALKR